MSYKIFAWISVALLFYNFSLFPLRRILKRFERARSFLKIGSRIHRFSGFALLVTGAIHGYLALGRIQLHTGTLLWLGVVLLSIYYLLRRPLKKHWLVLHRFTDFIVIAWFFVHFFFPWLI
ncbi:MAG: hypothetical protein ACPLTP_06680 [Thermotoga caldifontis]|uniref:hypothetical protein n=1 Tax=Thermotoga caldifontis TaxID=1508419 RepID=UPI003C7C9F2F